MAKTKQIAEPLEEAKQPQPTVEQPKDAPKSNNQAKPVKASKVKIMVSVGLVKEKGVWKYKELNGAVGSVIADRSNDRFSVIDLIHSITDDSDAIAFALGKRSIPNSRVNMENVANVALAVARGDFLSREICESMLSGGDTLQVRLNVANSLVEHVLSHQNLYEYCPAAQGYWQRGMTTNNVSALEMTRALIKAASVNLVPTSAIRKLVAHILERTIAFVESAPADLDGKTPLPARVKSIIKMFQSKLAALEVGDPASVADWAFKHAILRAPRSWAKV